MHLIKEKESALGPAMRCWVTTSIIRTNN